MKGARFHHLARLELEDATNCYDGEQPGLGEEFAGEVEYAIRLLVRFPEIGYGIHSFGRRLE